MFPARAYGGVVEGVSCLLPYSLSPATIASAHSNTASLAKTEGCWPTIWLACSISIASSIDRIGEHCPNREDRC